MTTRIHFTLRRHRVLLLAAAHPDGVHVESPAVVRALETARLILCEGPFWRITIRGPGVGASQSPCGRTP